ncbi:hypothetical protein E1B28_011289 [Marasmius oreades]|uniref:Sodium/calcium exchanger membrane region domain-containing protein n=1 Tax=Marasmius oreades TaxID=181124 RepID=A0A9P7RV52_9AGAR|nr:uncharacterized protein E1B28_011289 [Marasmius oreades]KAG7089623.1 hypothetical protein E1B28_011289 [Marasmius oreades]
MSNPSSKVIFLTFFLLNCLLWSNSRYGNTFRTSTNVQTSLVKRVLDALETPNECHPITFPVDQQCPHVSESCPRFDSFLSIQYLRNYFCTDASLRSASFVGLLVWLIFLFSTLGISASDFFTPNLATIAQMLGLDENVAGVTFLAFGNGSPDLFSTFSAMRANSGSLAIGELLGAASFIVSCVVGSICIIKPFQVNPRPFLRDVGFFTAAVTMLLVILWDGHIRPWEAAAMVLLYLTYVSLVVIGTWWDRRKLRLRVNEATARAEYQDDDIPPGFDIPYRDEPSQQVLLPPSPGTPRARAISQPNPPRISTDVASRPYSRSPSPTPRASPQFSHLPSFSLVGALEFRQVVASLRQDASGSSLHMFDSPITPYAGGHYHPSTRSLPRTPRESAINPFDESLGLPLNSRSPQIVVGDTPHGFARSGQYFDDDPSPSMSSIPAIQHTPASPTATETDSESQLHSNQQPTRWRRIKYVLSSIYHTLFPSLHHFKNQSVLGKIVAVFAAPAVTMLTLTLPVVVTPYEYSRVPGREKPVTREDGNSHNLIGFEEEGVERVLVAEEDVQEEMHGVEFNKWLTAVQCMLGPIFSVGVLFNGNSKQPWLFLAVGIAGFAAATLVIVFAERGDNSAFMMARCSMGFIVAVVWIMAIADEVVSVLQTFGFIFGLSDAIIGLTIFAVGNSLADLVANMSIAVFAPIMGFSACFGGPMLNILLGVGISGSYITSKTGVPYKLHFGTTLFVSSIGLLALLASTLIVVPLNGYQLTRPWGIFLIASYITIMAINVVVELRGSG